MRFVRVISLTTRELINSRELTYKTATNPLRSEFLIVERRPQFFYNRKLTKKIFADGRKLDSGLKKNFSHTGI